MLIESLKSFLDKGQVLSGMELKDRYHHIWKMEESLQAVALVMPRNTEELSKIMKTCYAHGQKVVIHGGLTNLVGGTETHKDELVISMEKMNKIQSVDLMSRTMTVEAGLILQDIQEQAKVHDLLFPLNFGAKGTAQIGGIISTNAGGLRVLRYGVTRHQILGLEVVTADGQIISSMKKIIKDNSAYDIKQLFIGSEGTLGIVSRAVLKLSSLPKSRVSAFVGFNEYAKVVDFLKFMDGGLAGTLSGFELIWQESFIAMTSPPALVKAPLGHDYRYYVLVESMGSKQERDQALMQDLLEEALEKKLILDGTIAQSQADLDWFWTIREDVHVLVSQCNNDQHFDISLPINLIGDTLEKIVVELKLMEEVEKVFVFGHVADGNIHLIIGKRVQSDALIHRINEIIYAPLKDIGGSVSAEHGIGLHKKAYLHYCRSEAEISMMRMIKKTMDPKNLLNRGKVVDG